MSQPTPHHPLRPCPICQCSQCQSLRHQRFILPEGHPLSGGYDVVCCDRCGFVYADTAVMQADYDRFYREHSKYEDQQTSTGGSEVPWDTQRLHDTACCIASRTANHAARILDIGCANGGLLKHLATMGYSNLTGLDPSPACVANTRAIPGIQAHVGSLSSLPEALGTFDLVILSHVLEHVQDLHNAASAITQLLALAGTVYIEVPDATRYADAVPAPFQDFNTEHINHFSLPSLANLMRQIGMQPIHEGTKTLLAPPPNPYPACFAVYQPAANIAPEPVKGQQLQGRIRAYIAISTAKMAELDSHLRAALPAHGPIIVWGVGQLTMKLLVDTVLATTPIAAFVDGNPIHQGHTLRGIPILPPPSISRLPHPILIASTLHDQAITTTIREKLGLANPIIHLTGPTGQ